MRTQVIRVNGKKGILFSNDVLALIGADLAQEFEVRTDGRQLLLAPVAPASRPAEESRQLAHTGDFDDPKTTLRIVKEATQLGFTPDMFRVIHHFGPKASLESHLRYCAGTGRFTSKTNPVVGQRLSRALELKRGGASWDDALSAAVKEFPFPAKEA